MSPDLGLSSWLDEKRRHVIEQSFEFTLIPWRPVIERQLGREVMGIIQGDRWRGGWEGSRDFPLNTQEQVSIVEARRAVWSIASATV